jgi:TorA maturation chaperone TorD
VGCHLVRHGLSGEQALQEIDRLWQNMEKRYRQPRSPETDEQAEYVRNWSEVIRQKPLLPPDPLSHAFRLLAHFWLEELKLDDLPTLAALPELAETLPNLDSAALTGLAAEYQRLFGFNLPPYESLFLDPSAMLMAPSTERLQQLYQQAGWQPPGNVRAGAPDHLGLELLALADGLETGQANLAHRLQTRHLALWLPPFVLTLRRLQPQPFYARLGHLTLELILTSLPEEALPPDGDPFPRLPPTIEQGIDADEGLFLELAPPNQAEPEEISLRDVINQLLPPCQLGLYLSREDIARIGRALGSPGIMGERYRMLDSLFRFAGQYDLLPPLFEQLDRILTETDTTYQELALEFPTWTPYAQAWRRRVASARTGLAELKQTLDSTPFK